MRRILASKIYIISVVIILLLLLAAFTAPEDSKLGAVRNILTAPLSPLQKGIETVRTRLGF